MLERKWVLSRRGFMFVSYLLCLMAGCFFIIFPSPAFKGATGIPLIIVWHSFLILGGSLAMFGVKKKWIAFEGAGLLLLTAALVAYIIVLVASGIGAGVTRAGSGASFGVGCFIAILVLNSVERCVELVERFKIRSHLDHSEGEKGR